MTTEDKKQLDNLILAESNVKLLVRHIAKTEKGDLAIVFDSNEYYLTLDSVKIDAPRTLTATVNHLYK